MAKKNNIQTSEPVADCNQLSQVEQQTLKMRQLLVPSPDEVGEVAIYNKFARKPTALAVG